MSKSALYVVLDDCETYCGVDGCNLAVVDFKAMENAVDSEFPISKEELEAFAEGEGKVLKDLIYAELQLKEDWPNEKIPGFKTIPIVDLLEAYDAIHGTHYATPESNEVN